MKKLFLTLLLITAGAMLGHAQKFAFIDTEYIFENIPEYQEAQKQLDALSKQWQEQIEQKYAAIDKMYQDYQAEEILLTEEMKSKRREEIILAEQSAKEFQKSKFGVEGELFEKRQELIKPIQEKIYKAVQETANLGQYSIIFDKASGATMVYTNPRYDKSDDVLRRMGYKSGNEE